MRKTVTFISMAVTLAAVLTVVGVTGNGNGAAATRTARFVDNGDATITDTQTGLMWEKKTGTFGGSPITCSNPTNCPDPTNVNNVYTWSLTDGAANGTLFTDFLEKMNCTIAQDGICGPGLYRDWRIPSITELLTIRTPDPLRSDCSTSPCIDPIFGPTAGVYWSWTSHADDFSLAYFVSFRNRLTIVFSKTNSRWA